MAGRGTTPYVPPLPHFAATEQELARFLLDALTSLQGDTDATRKVLDALTNGRGAQAIADLAAADWTDLLAGAAQRYADAYQAAAEASTAEGVPGLLLDVPLPDVAYARTWAREHTATLVENVTATTRQSVAAVVDRALAQGWSVPDTARAIGQTAGLNTRQSTALANYRETLQGQGLADQLVASRAQAFSNRLHAQRANTIARTELSAAANAGRYKGWLLATMSGALGPDAVKEWLAAPGCCPECADLDGEQVTLAEDFPGDGGPMPPAHPNCRCTAIVVDPGGDALAAEQTDDGVEPPA